MLIQNRRNPVLRLLATSGIVVVMMVTGLFVLATAVMTSPSTLDPHTEELTDLGAVTGGLGMLLLLTLPWYRRAPLVLIIAGTVGAIILQTDPFVLAVGLTVWIVRCRKRWQWVVAGAGLGVILINAGLHFYRLSAWPDEDYQQVGRVLVASLTVLCLILVLGISLWARQRHSAQQAEAQAQSAQHSSEQLSDELARRREREDLAREVHDTLAGRLSGLSLQVGSLEQSAQRGEDGQLDDALRTTRRYADQALADLRTLLTSLRETGAPSSTPAQTPAGIPDLEIMLDDAKASGLDVRTHILLDGYSSAPPALQRTILRITQEALTNALRYSNDRVVQMGITGDPQRGVHLRFSNQIAAASEFSGGSGTGLVGLRERAELLGGSVEIQTEGGEFTLTVFLPWSEADR
ncbi:hypothetical protein HGQ17_07640 [Nesterenkonia sp. MY13]|uniref:histidine kinase n=1 Tax=Nesterenkonia sedimenti TaxID=1463632 RepID=A0A7X8TJD4_9MICC|nr:histidine kinase [Nesterenkonia sedimenti]NLS09875.1 hypothetical protein [Nesterenkonia sedimenti]